MTKKMISLLMALCMLLPGLAAAEETAETHVVVGAPTRLSGRFFTELWGNNTADIDVRVLLHDQATVAWTHDQQYIVNTQVVKAISQRQDEQGNMIYTIDLNHNGYFSNGERINAQDYVFSILLQSCPELAGLGVENTAYTYLTGYEAYHSGEAKSHAGVRLVDDDTFCMTVQAEYLPFFYQLTYLNVIPYPIEVLAPGCMIVDEGRGAFIKNLTTEKLAESILNPETGYLTHPSVVSGPYMLESYNEATGTAEFVRNPWYPGNYEGQKAQIDRLTYREIKYADALALLSNGEIDVVHKATDGEFIDQGLAAANVSHANYGRTGYGFMAFACEREELVTGSVKVRQAMAHCLDRDQMIEDFLHGYGLPVYSYYGLGLWVAREQFDSIADEVTRYAYNTRAAEKLLEEDGWTLNSEGNDFQSDTDAVRYKQLEDGTLVPLEIRFASLEDNNASKWILDNYKPVLESIGFAWNTTDVTFDQLLSHYYRQAERTYNLMYLATNFTMVYDPWYTFHTAPSMQGVYNTSGIADEQLMNISWAMHTTPAGDVDAFTELWKQLMKRFSDVLPTLPIYTNYYYDFYSPRLEGYAPDANWTWAQAILYTRVK